MANKRNRTLYIEEGLKIDGKKNPQWHDPQESIIKGSYQPNRNGNISWIPACAGMTFCFGLKGELCVPGFPPARE